MFAAVLLWCWEPCTVLCRQTDGTMAGTEMTKCDDGTYIAGRRSLRQKEDVRDVYIVVDRAS